MFFCLIPVVFFHVAKALALTKKGKASQHNSECLNRSNVDKQLGREEHAEDYTVKV